MKDKRFLVALLLFILGMAGVLSMLAAEIPLDPTVKQILKEQYSEIQIKLILLINPALFLIISIAAGIFIYDKLDFKLPIIESVIARKPLPNILNILTYAVIGGIVAGTLIILVAQSYSSFLPQELCELGNDVKPGVLMRLLYGGFTEEILMRFGIMTVIVWLLSFLLGKRHVTYWIGIVLSAFIFGLGHFPVVFQSIEDPSFLLLTYILVGNSTGGIIFGWLYWKKGLESAMIAHMFAHITMIVAEYLVMAFS